MTTTCTTEDFYVQCAPNESRKSYDNQWMTLKDAFVQRYSKVPQLFCSMPGRIEIIGNHLDHARGAVIAAGVDLDIRSCAVSCDDTHITYYSLNNDSSFVVALSDSADTRPDSNPTCALMQGVCAWFLQHGYKVGGMQIVMHSSIPMGMGLSSSAAFSCSIAFLMSKFYNEDRLTQMELAICAQFAESVYMKKPCGLMDQLASVYGGLQHISFVEDPPSVTKMDVLLEDLVWIVSTYGEGHGDKTADYAAIKTEMHGVAQILGAAELGLCEALTGDGPESWKHVFTKAVVQQIQSKYSSRALLRAMHFVQERNRVETFRKAVLGHDQEGMKQLIRESGESSWILLQNVVSTHDVYDYALMLNAARQVDRRLGAASRVHGGGFGGSVISLVDSQTSDAYMRMLKDYCPGVQSCIVHIRPYGAVEILR